MKKVNKIQEQIVAQFIRNSGDTITISLVQQHEQWNADRFWKKGTVDWQTIVKTSTFTAASGEGYFVDTNGGAVTANLPAGTAGAIVAFKDYRNTFDTNALTIAQNGSDKIGGSTVNATIDTEGVSVTLVFIDSTRGWLVVNDGSQSELPRHAYIS